MTLNELKVKEGDNFKFSSAVVTARKISKPLKIAGSSKHRTQRVKCESGFIYVEKTWKSVNEQKNKS